MKGMGYLCLGDTCKLDDPSLLLHLHHCLVFGHSLISEHDPDHLK